MTIDFTMNIGASLSETRRAELYNPITNEPMFDDKGQPFYVDCLASAASEWKEASQRLKLKYNRIAAKNRGEYRGALSPEQAETMAAELHAAAVRGWHIGPADGAPAWDIPCTSENVTAWLMAGENHLFQSQISAVTDDITLWKAEMEQAGNASATKSSAPSSTSSKDSSN